MDKEWGVQKKEVNCRRRHPGGLLTVLPCCYNMHHFVTHYFDFSPDFGLLMGILLLQTLHQ